MRYDFHILKTGKVVSYTSVIAGAAFCSLHNCNDMTEAQAKLAFHRQHKQETLILFKQKQIEDDIKSKTNTA